VGAGSGRPRSDPIQPGDLDLLGVLKKRYDLSKYEHLPAAEYAGCVDFIKQSYAKLTGDELTGEQLRFLEFDEH
jgi:hypothetical protein